MQLPRRRRALGARPARLVVGRAASACRLRFRIVLAARAIRGFRFAPADASALLRSSIPHAKERMIANRALSALSLSLFACLAACSSGEDATGANEPTGTARSAVIKG